MNYDRVLIEMLDRVKKLELEVEELKRQNLIMNGSQKEQKPEFNYENIQAGLFGKDTTKYFFEGKLYGKSRLVLAVIKRYVERNTNTKVNELKTIFDASLQGNKNLGVVISKEDAIKRADYKKRYFTLPQEEVRLADGVCLVCTQWGIGNINNFIARAKQLGFEITSNN